MNNATAFILALAVGASAPSPGGGIADFAPLSRKEAAEERAVCVTGVVTEIRPGGADQAMMSLATPEGTLDVRVRAPFADLAGLPDAEVDVEGVAMSVYNHRAEYLGMRLELAGPDGIFVAKPAPADPFTARQVPLDSILSWTPHGHDGHRRLVSGTVTAARADGTFYLQSGRRVRRNGSSRPC